MKHIILTTENGNIDEEIYDFIMQEIPDPVFVRGSMFRGYAKVQMKEPCRFYVYRKTGLENLVHKFGEVFVIDRGFVRSQKSIGAIPDLILGYSICRCFLDEDLQITY